jgi:hypothetical protein
MVITTLIEMLIIWLPSLVSILGIVATICGALGKTKKAIADLKDSTELKEATAEMKRIAAENQELIRCNKLLLDQITRIKGYADTKKEE